MNVSNYLIRIVLIGNSNSGKTCIINYFIGKGFKSTISSFGFNCEVKWLEDSNCKIIIYDTVQQECYRTSLIDTLKKCKGIIIVYDINNEYSFKNIEEEWINVINKYVDISKVKIALVGNKKDLENERIISEENGKKLAEKYNFLFFEASAKNGENINDVFKKLSEEIIKDIKNNPEKNETFVLKQKNKIKKKNC